jgi:4-diphosphocytidyl-2C-methyl-D-erythritol kinase
VVVPSEHALSAGDVYAEADRLGVERGPDELAAMHEQLSAALEREGRPPDELLVNDLGAAAISLCPEITGALSSLREAGADHELVSGSGPTTFGLFWGPDCEQRARAAVASLDLPATSTVPWSSGSDIHALRHNLDSTDE